MSQVPPDYEPSTDFSTIAAQPILTTGLPGAEIDAELTAIAETTNDTIDRLNEIQRDDGQIRNGMVKMHTLASDVLALLTAGSASIRGQWQSGQSYEVGDVVSQPFSSSLLVAGTLSPDATGTLFLAGLDTEGYPIYSNTGGSGDRVYGTYPYVEIRADVDNDQWVLTYRESEGDISIESWVATLGATGFPWEAVDWDEDSPVSGTGTPDVSELVIYNYGTFIAISSHLSGDDFDGDIRYWGLIAAPPSAGNLSINQFTGDGAETDFALSTTPLSEANTQVYIDGVYQPKSTYSLTGSTITFSAAPPNASVIEVVSGVTVEVQTAVVADNAVTEDKIADGAVTEDKIADGAVTADKLAAGAAVPDGSITAAKLQSNSVTTDKIAAGNVTEGKIASGAVSEDKIATGAVTTTRIASSAVTTAKIADSNVTTDKLATSAVATAKIADSAVTSAKIADEAVTLAKIPDNTITAAKLASGTLDTTIDARPGMAKAACRFSLSTSPALVGNDLNVASVTSLGGGDFRVTFTTAFANANFIPLVSIFAPPAGTPRVAVIEAIATTHVDIHLYTSAFGNTNGAVTDSVSLIVLAP